MVRVLDLHRIGKVAGDCYTQYKEKQQEGDTVQVQVSRMPAARCLLTADR